MGDRIGHLRRAERKIREHLSIEILASSTVLETPPHGYSDQPFFLNQILKIRTGLSPSRLLEELNIMENDLGRKRSKRWGPRTIDIDILMYGERIIDTPSLQIPHPRLLDRPFFIRMITELDAEVTDPVTGLRLIDLMRDWGEADLSSAGKPYEDLLCPKTGK
jgi:2-amino-4-hydroxy-6-hydroxymethyldihydropteridine diphosphokinase